MSLSSTTLRVQNLGAVYQLCAIHFCERGLVNQIGFSSISFAVAIGVITEQPTSKKTLQNIT